MHLSEKDLNIYHSIFENSWNYKFIITIYVLFFFSSTNLLYAQPCLTGWSYRQEITITNNSSNVLSNYPVELDAFVLNTKNLVLNGKAKSDGSDLRFTNASGQQLDFWIENSTYNTLESRIWVKIESFPALSPVTIYVFYGNSNAYSYSNGEATFPFFDDFNTNLDNWIIDGGGTAILSNGDVIITSGSADSSKAVLKSIDTSSPDYYSIMKVENIGGSSSGTPFIGQVDDNYNGYALAGNTNEMDGYTLVLSYPASPPNLFDITSLGAGNSSTFNNVWQISWHNTTKQSCKIRNSGLSLTNNNNTHTQPASLYTVMGVFGGATSVTIDWVAHLPYIDTLPSATSGIEIEIPNTGNVTVSSNSPLCEGDSLYLSASNISGATYNWFFPDGNPYGTGNAPSTRIPLPSQTGAYDLVVTGLSGCASYTTSTWIDVSKSTEEGSVIGGGSVCQGSNSGNLELHNYTGDIQRWEYSTTGSNPWANIELDSYVLNYENLNQTTWFRASVKSGKCNTETTIPVLITVKNTSEAGNIVGEGTLCEGSELHLEANPINGNVINWLKKTDSSLWVSTDMPGKDYFDSTIIENSAYKVVVQNAPCLPDTSQPFIIQVDKQTIPGEVLGHSVCEGESGVVIASGYRGDIQRWELSTSGGNPWSAIFSYDDSLDYHNISETTFFRTVIKNGICESAISKTDTVVVDTKPSGGNIIGGTSVCAGNNLTNLNLTNYKGNISHWEWSKDSISWNSITNKKDTYAVTNLNNKRYYRALVNSTLKICKSNTATPDVIYVNTPTDPGNMLGNALVCGNQNNGVLNLAGYNGSIIRWEQSVSGKAPWYIIDNETDSIIYENLKNDTYYRAIVKNGVCNQVKSDSGVIFVNSSTVTGSLTGSTSVCALNNNGTINLEGNNGTIQKWLISDNLKDWEIKSGNSSILTYENLDKTTYYSVEVKNGVCKADTSAPVAIVVNPLPSVNFLADTIDQGKKMYFTNISYVESGSVIGYNWLMGDGEGSLVIHPIHTYSQPGNFNVKLQVTTDKGCIDSINKSVFVKPIPKVDFSFNNVCLGSPIIFTNKSTISMTGATYFWDFGDGSPIVSQLNTEHIYNTANEFKVTLTSVTDMGSSDSVSYTVKTYHRPFLDFSFENACAGEEVKFSNGSTINEGNVNYLWDFGDGITETDVHASHTYSQANQHTVVLHAKTNYQCSDTLRKIISIHPIPVVGFSITDVPLNKPSFIVESSSITTGNIKQWFWDFGDNNTSNTREPVHVYNSPGLFKVGLIAVSDSGCIGSMDMNTKVYPAPIANFLASPICNSDSMYFNNLSVISSGNLTYQWDFGDGNTHSIKNPSHFYNKAESYIVTLIVTSEEMAKDTIKKIVDVYPEPLPFFTATTPCDGETMKFTNQSTVEKGLITKYEWDFNDGTNSVQEEPEKLYLNPGNYNVRLKITSDFGCKKEYANSVTVNSVPIASFQSQNVCSGYPVKFHNTSINDNGYPSYQWDFGNNETSIHADPEYTYNLPGNYTVSLKVNSNINCSDSIKKNIRIYSPPMAEAGNDTLLTRGESVYLEGSGGTYFDWQPSAGLDNPTLSNPLARPDKNTTYMLRVIDQNGCMATDTVQVNVKESFVLKPTNVITPDDGNDQNDTWKIGNIDFYEGATVHIFNDWGVEVFTRKNYKNDWRGKNKNGDALPDGTYYYIIEFENSDRHYTGSITLIRN